MNKPPYPIIDADGHVREGLAIDWKARLPREYQKWAPYMVSAGFGRDRMVFPFETPKDAPEPPVFQGGLTGGYWKGKKKEESARRAGTYDPHARIPDMDAEGIDLAVLFGGRVGLGAAGLEDARFATCLARIYNDWLAEYCLAYPRRLKGVAVLPVQDIEWSVQEVGRAKSLGFVGVVVPPNIRGKNLNDASLRPVFKEAERANLALCVHGGQGMPGQRIAGADQFDKFFYWSVLANPFENIIALTAMIAGGVLDECPDLRVAYLEGGVGWAPFFMERMDERYEQLASQVQCKAKPSEYIRTRCWFSGDPDEELLPEVAERIGEDRLLFASDYFHFDSKFPDTVRLVTDREDMPASLKRAMLCDNPARLYRLTLNGKKR